MARNVWGIVLTGGIVERGGAGRWRAGRSRKPAWPVSPRHVLFRQTLDRASRLIPSERLVAVLTREHSAYYASELADLPGVRRVLQPAYRGSGPELFLSVLHIATQDPHAVVVVLPSDHLVDGEARLMSCVQRATLAVGFRPDLALVIGAHPVAPDPACAWIDPGPPVEGLESFGVRAVRRFVPRPSRPEQAALLDGQGLVNTQVVIGRARTLLDLGRRYLPDVLESLEPLERAFGAPEEPLLCEAVYEQMPYADLAHALFVRPHHVAVVPVTDVRLHLEEPPALRALAS